jgi:hypothetical protein
MKTSLLQNIVKLETLITKLKNLKQPLQNEREQTSRAPCILRLLSQQRIIRKRIIRKRIIQKRIIHKWTIHVLTDFWSILLPNITIITTHVPFIFESIPTFYSFIEMNNGKVTIFQSLLVLWMLFEMWPTFWLSRYCDVTWCHKRTLFVSFVTGVSGPNAFFLPQIGRSMTALLSSLWLVDWETSCVMVFMFAISFCPGLHWVVCLSDTQFPLIIQKIDNCFLHFSQKITLKFASSFGEKRREEIGKKESEIHHRKDWDRTLNQS